MNRLVLGDCQKSYPMHQASSTYQVAGFGRGLSIPQGLGTIADWLRTLDNLPLSIDSTSWNALKSLMRFTRSCNSCICEVVSTCTAAWLSLNSSLENSSIRISWALFNSPTCVNTSDLSFSKFSFWLRRFFVKSGLLSSRCFISKIGMVNRHTTRMNLSFEVHK